MRGLGANGRTNFGSACKASCAQALPFCAFWGTTPLGLVTEPCETRWPKPRRHAAWAIRIFQFVSHRSRNGRVAKAAGSIPAGGFATGKRRSLAGEGREHTVGVSLSSEVRLTVAPALARSHPTQKASRRHRIARSLALTAFTSKPTGSNTPPTHDRKSLCCSWVLSRSAARNSAYPCGPPTSSGGQAFSPARQTG